jgi:hypothetical protein
MILDEPANTDKIKTLLISVFSLSQSSDNNWHYNWLSITAVTETVKHGLEQTPTNFLL